MTTYVRCGRTIIHFAFGQFPKRPLCVAYGTRMTEVYKWPLTDVPAEVTCCNCTKTIKFRFRYKESPT